MCSGAITVPSAEADASWDSCRLNTLARDRTARDRSLVDPLVGWLAGRSVPFPVSLGSSFWVTQWLERSGLLEESTHRQIPAVTCGYAVEIVLAT